MKTLGERFWSKVNQGDSCWEWFGCRIPGGYGQIYVEGKMLLAHRVSYSLTNGPIPDGLMVDHMCHNRACVRPDHLRIATAKQNMENQVGAMSNNRSCGIRGVTWKASQNRWQATVGHHGKRYYVGLYVNVEDAAKAVRDARNRLFTHNIQDRGQK